MDPLIELFSACEHLRDKSSLEVFAIDVSEMFLFAFACIEKNYSTYEILTKIQEMNSKNIV